MEAIQQYYVVEQSYAGHCAWGGSDKEYAICQVHVVDSPHTTESDEPIEAKNRMILVSFGKTGALKGGAPTALLTKGEAEAEFKKTVRQKSQSHHYTPLPGLPFANYMRYFQLRDHLLFPSQESEASRQPVPPTAEASSPFISQADPRYAGCEVVEISWDELHALLMNPHYGATEKEDGHRCPLAYNGKQLTAYNRNGVAQLTVPEAALALADLGSSFLIDGEQLVNSKRKGHYTCFDLLEWRGNDLRTQPYRQRITTLQQAMKEAGLLKEMRTTPTVHSALANSTRDGLALLTPTVEVAEAAAFLISVHNHGGEGYIVRRLEAAYSDKKAVLKRKIRADIDVFAYSIKPGKNGGSLQLALRRPSDNVAIACGKVRAGLTPEDMRWFAEQIAAGITPVLTVEFLPKRSEGIAVVEGTTGRDRVRTDKTPWDCTTAQWGQEKAGLVAQAKPLAGVTLLERVRQ